MGGHPKYQEPDSAFLDKVQRYRSKINLSVCPADFVELWASRYRYAKSICEPGYLDRLPPVALPVDGLFIADTSDYYPGDRGISESIGFGREMARMAIG